MPDKQDPNAPPQKKQRTDNTIEDRENLERGLKKREESLKLEIDPHNINHIDGLTQEQTKWLIGESYKKQWLDKSVDGIFNSDEALKLFMGDDFDLNIIRGEHSDKDTKMFQEALKGQIRNTIESQLGDQFKCPISLERFGDEITYEDTGFVIESGHIYPFERSILNLQLSATELNPLTKSFEQRFFCKDKMVAATRPIRDRKYVEQKILEARQDGEDPDLSNLDLRYIDFTGLDLEGANFENSNLDNCNFRSQTLEGVNFDHTSLDNTDFTSSHFTNVSIKNATTNKTKFVNCNFQGGDLSNFELKNAFFNGANFDYCTLDGASFGDSDLTGTTMINASAKETVFIGANMEGSNLDDADFTQSDLINSNLKNASTQKTNFYDTDPRCADFTGTNLSDTQKNNISESLKECLQRPSIGASKTSKDDSDIGKKSFFTEIENARKNESRERSNSL